MQRRQSFVYSSIFSMYIHAFGEILYAYTVYMCDVRCALSTKQQKNGRSRAKSMQNENVQRNVSKWITRPRLTLIRIFQSQKFFHSFFTFVVVLFQNSFIEISWWKWFRVAFSLIRTFTMFEIFFFLLFCFVLVMFLFFGGLMVVIEFQNLMYRQRLSNLHWTKY